MKIGLKRRRGAEALAWLGAAGDVRFLIAQSDVAASTPRRARRRTRALRRLAREQARGRTSF